MHPVEVDMLMLRQDFPVMFLFTVMLFFMAYGISGPGRISLRATCRCGCSCSAR